LKIERTLELRKPPSIQGDTVHVSISRWTSEVRIVTDTLAVIDYIKEDPMIPVWYIFREGPTRVYWKDLTDSERFATRMAVMIDALGNFRQEWGRKMGEYEDDRYYTLEALVED